MSETMDALLRAAGFDYTNPETFKYEAPPGTPACPHCGATVTVRLVLTPGRYPMAHVSHPTPVCAEFALALESDTRRF